MPEAAAVSSIPKVKSATLPATDGIRKASAIAAEAAISEKAPTERSISGASHIAPIAPMLEIRKVAPKTASLAPICALRSGT